MILYVIIALLFGWITVLTWIIIKTRTHYFSLISRTKKERIDDILDELLKIEKGIVKDLDLVKKELKEDIIGAKLHLQKVGLLRFNPFERMSGEQSFVIALLDYHNSGILVNFIYTREGLRVYTKKVKYGKGEEYELSEEEKKAIEKSEKK